MFFILIKAITKVRNGLFTVALTSVCMSRLHQVDEGRIRPCLRMGCFAAHGNLDSWTILLFSTAWKTKENNHVGQDKALRVLKKMHHYIILFLQFLSEMSCRWFFHGDCKTKISSSQLLYLVIIMPRVGLAIEVTKQRKK